MKKVYLTTAAVAAMFFSVNTATAQETETTTQNATEQTQQQEEFQEIQEQDLPNEVREALQRDFEGATVSEAYLQEKDGERKYKLVIGTLEGENAELYADAEGNWIENEGETREEE